MIRKSISYYITRNNNWQRIATTVLFFIFWISSLKAQVTPDKVHIVDVIADIESNFHYKFTYADDTLADVFISPPKKNLSFTQILDFLRKETGLVFSRLANNFVSINKRKASFLICGLLKDRDTKQFLQGVTIRGKKTSSVSGANGRFDLEVFTDNETIRVDHLGYKTIYRLADSFVPDQCAIIYLEPQTVTLAEVVLRNYITKGINRINDGSFQINYENFGILPGLIETDVLQTIQAVPGVKSADETVSNINIRGGTHDQNLILWDGIKMYQTGHFFGLISAINPLMTRKATLLKNGTNPEYTDSISGTIIMNTDTKITKDFEISMGINMIHADAFADIPMGEQSSLQITTRKSIRDLIETPTYSQYFKRISQDSEVEEEGVVTSDIDFDFSDVNLRWNYDISLKDKLRINFLTINNKLVFTENQEIQNIQQSRQSSLKQNSLAGGLWYQRVWNDDFKSILQVYETGYDLKAINANVEQEQRFLQNNKVSETGIKLKTYYDLDEKITLLNGYQFIETGVSNLNDIDTPVFREKRDRVLRTHSLFSQVCYAPRETSSLKFGVRYNYNTKFKTHTLEPRISFNQKISNYFNVEFLGELKQQNTSQIINFQNDFLGIEKRRWVLSNNDDIPLIQSKQASLGVQYTKSDWLINADGYYKKVNGITARSQGFQNQYEFVRAIGKYTVRGLDFLLNKRYKRLSAWMSYSYTHNTYDFNSFDEEHFPNNIDIKHTIGLGSAYALEDFKFSAGLNWNSGLPTTRPSAEEPVTNNQINYQNANSSRLDKYLRMDISATYDFVISKGIQAHAGVSVWNLIDKQNVINNYYRIGQENVPQEVVESSLDITPNATFRVAF